MTREPIAVYNGFMISRSPENIGKDHKPMHVLYLHPLDARTRPLKRIRYKPVHEPRALFKMKTFIDNMEEEKIIVPKSLDGKICFRLLAMAQFIKANGELGYQQCKYRLLPGAYKYAINFGGNLQKQILAAYKPAAGDQLNVILEADRIKDISLVFDELIDANNIEELLELVKAHKK